MERGMGKILNKERGMERGKKGDMKMVQRKERRKK